MKTLALTSESGKVLELRARCTITLVDDIRDLDGDTMNFGTKTQTDAMLEVYFDGKKIDSSWDVNFWSLIDVSSKPGYKRIWGIEKVLFTPERAQEVESFLKNIISEGTEPAVNEKQTADADAKKSEKIEAAKSVISQSKTTIHNPDGTLMTRAQASTWKYRYNQINNEGGDGFVPDVVTIEDIAWANSVLG